MFDIGISELAIVGVVALIVIGPEELPRVARTAGHLLGRLKRYVSDVKSDISREMDLAELSRMKQEVVDSARDIEQSIHDEARAFQQDVDDAVNALRGPLQDDKQDDKQHALHAEVERIEAVVDQHLLDEESHPLPVEVELVPRPETAAVQVETEAPVDESQLDLFAIPVAAPNVASVKKTAADVPVSSKPSPEA